MTAPSGIKTVYTPDGPLLDKVEWKSGTASLGMVAYGYDSDWRLSSLTVGTQSPIEFDYDDDDLLTNAGDLVIERVPDTGAVHKTYLGAIVDERAYGPTYGELESYTVTSSAGVAEPLKIEYLERDYLGRVKKKKETLGTLSGTTSRTLTYSYDGRGRLEYVHELAGTTSTLVSHYTYDANGNRLSWDNGGALTAGAYDNQDRLISYGSTVFEYDDAGNLRKRTDGAGATQYYYDRFGNLLHVDLPTGDKLDYVHDAAGRLIAKKKNGITVETFLWDGRLRPVAATIGGTAFSFVYGLHVNVPEYMIRDGVRYRLVSDDAGSVRLVVNDESGAIEESLSYDEFGNVESSNPGFQPFGFSGGLYDRDTKLVHLGCRDYDPSVGRWTSKDPIRFAGHDAMLYSYVGNDPINLYDPTGTDAWSIAENFAIGAGTAILGGVAIAGAITAGGVLLPVLGGYAIAFGIVQLGLTAASVIKGADIITGKRLDSEERADMVANVAGGLVGGGVSMEGFAIGREYELPIEFLEGPNGAPARIAPWGNRTGNRFGERPHFHRALPDPCRPGMSKPGQGIKNHRPWEGGWGL